MSLKGKHGMLGIDHQDRRFKQRILEPIRRPGSGEQGTAVCRQRREEVYNWVERTLLRLQYASTAAARQGRDARYLVLMTGLSMAQATRLITGISGWAH